MQTEMENKLGAFKSVHPTSGGGEIVSQYFIIFFFLTNIFRRVNLIQEYYYHFKSIKKTKILGPNIVVWWSTWINPNIFASKSAFFLPWEIQKQI